jgi:hypothetical protein
MMRIGDLTTGSLATTTILLDANKKFHEISPPTTKTVIKKIPINRPVIAITPFGQEFYYALSQ